MVIQEPAPRGRPAERPGLLLRLVRDQRVAFLVIGGVNTLIGLGWFLLFHRLVGGVVGYLGTLLLAHVCSVLCAFVLHRRLVFRVRGNVLTDLGRFELVNLGGLGLNAVALTFFVEVAGLPVVLSQVLATVFSVVGTYLGHRTFSFRRRPRPVRDGR